jgi:hypothetical protein
MKLNEIRILSGIHPTDNQKRVLAIIIASPSPKVANEELTGDENLMAARNILMKLGVVTVVAGAAELTDKGTQIAQDERITDETGQLTDLGNELAFGAERPQPGEQPEMPGEVPMPGEEPPMPGNEPPLGGQTMPNEPITGLESFSMLRKVLNEMSHDENKSHTKK